MMDAQLRQTEQMIKQLDRPGRLVIAATVAFLLQKSGGEILHNATDTERAEAIALVEHLRDTAPDARAADAATGALALLLNKETQP